MSLTAAAKLRFMTALWVRCQRKLKKCNDQRAPIIRYYQIKESQSLDMKYYLVARGLQLQNLEPLSYLFLFWIYCYYTPVDLLLCCDNIKDWSICSDAIGEFVPGQSTCAAYFISLQSKSMIRLLEFFSIFFEILLKLSYL